VTHVIVVGNEKGGSGKSTTAFHIAIALAKAGRTVGALDLDVRQRSLTRYLENRVVWAKQCDKALAMPRIAAVRPSGADSREMARQEDGERLSAALAGFDGLDFVVVDCPGGDTALSRRALLHSDTVVTPMNDSFVDFDLLARFDAADGAAKTPSVFAEAIWEARKARALAGGMQKSIDWVVVRNRLAPHKTHNKRRVGEQLEALAGRIGFRIGPGVAERVVFRELFPYGLTLFDLGGRGSPLKLSMSHVSARQEMRSLVRFLNLPASERETARAA